GCPNNPIQDSIVAVFNTGDLIIQSFAFTDNGDNDGFADDNELVSVKLTLRNISTVDIDSVEVHLSKQTSTIQCINDPLAKYGRINVNQSKDNGSDLLQFTVANVNRTTLSQVLQGSISVAFTGFAIDPVTGAETPIEGTASPQSFSFDLDL